MRIPSGVLLFSRLLLRASAYPLDDSSAHGIFKPTLPSRDTPASSESSRSASDPGPALEHAPTFSSVRLQPDNHPCVAPYEWRHRLCSGSSPREYDDHCVFVGHPAELRADQDASQTHPGSCPIGTHCEQQAWHHLALKQAKAVLQDGADGEAGHWIVCKPDDGELFNPDDEYHPPDRRDEDEDEYDRDPDYEENGRFNSVFGRFVSNLLNAYASTPRHFYHLLKTRHALRDAVVVADVYDLATRKYLDGASADLQVRIKSDVSSDPAQLCSFASRCRRSCPATLVKRPHIRACRQSDQTSSRTRSSRFPAPCGRRRKCS